MQKNDTFENGLQNVRRIRKTFLSHFWSTICYNEIKKTEERKNQKERTRKKELERKDQKERTRKKELERKNQKERARKKEKIFRDK